VVSPFCDNGAPNTHRKGSSGGGVLQAVERAGDEAVPVASD
jgi:hypothetical protein